MMNAQTKERLDSRTKKRGAERWKTLLWPAVIGIPVIAVLVWMLVGLSPEPLTSEEILAKENWSEEELTDTLARAFAPQSNRGARREVLSHLRRQLRKYPEDKQKEIRIKALTGAMGETLRQIRAMPEEERDKMYAAIQKQAEKWHREAQSRQGKEMLEKIRTSEEGQALNTEVSRIIHSEFTPDERRKFAPITDVWIKTLKM
ncbi:MAG: hypothetical protein HPZ91_04510 [Lentisphaeria bacterium]|nr:hypothetical protein [Lentisphaeria bacterium]